FILADGDRKPHASRSGPCSCGGARRTTTERHGRQAHPPATIVRPSSSGGAQRSTRVVTIQLPGHRPRRYEQRMRWSRSWPYLGIRSGAPGIGGYPVAWVPHRLLRRQWLQLYLCRPRVVMTRHVGTRPEDLRCADHLVREIAGEILPRIRDAALLVRHLEVRRRAADRVAAILVPMPAVPRVVLGTHITEIAVRHVAEEADVGEPVALHVMTPGVVEARVAGERSALTMCDRWRRPRVDERHHEHTPGPLVLDAVGVDRVVASAGQDHAGADRAQRRRAR